VTQPASTSVAIIGGGLSGLACACSLADAGYRVTLFERKPYLGGRASSYEHPGTGETVDNCQHVLLGCCTNLIDFYRRLGVEQQIRWYERLTFIEPGGHFGTLSPGLLPAPFHSSFSFLRFPLLSFADKFGITRALLALMSGIPTGPETDFLTWLKQMGQTQRAIDRFWGPVLVSALNDELDQVSVRYGAMVFRDAFLKSAAAGRMGLPMVPLSELYGAAAEYIRQRGGEVLLRTPVEGFDILQERVMVRTATTQRPFDYVVPAVPFQALSKLLPTGAASDTLAEKLTHLNAVPITGIHLWFDREITPLEHAVLLDRTIQWMFQKSKILKTREKNGTHGSYLELVVSSSKTLLDKPRGEIIDLALHELAEFFPAVREATLVKSTVVKEVHATFSPAPGSDPYRLEPQTAWPRVFLSGDWTDTGWPATMEGAIRGGYKTAQAIAAATGNPREFLVPDLKPQGLMKMFKK
jgi:zeta-carotene desaturase